MRINKIIAAFNGLFLAVTIVISYLSNTGIFNGETMATMSMRYPTPMTPAPYAFSIWGLIYLSLIGFVGYYARAAFRHPGSGGPRLHSPGQAGMGLPDPVLRVGGWFIVTCLANCGWVLAWLYGQTGLSVVFMAILLASLMRIVVLTDMELTDPLWPEIVFVWWPFCLYSGWITAAIFANISAWFVKVGIGMSTFGAVFMLVLAGAAYLWMTWRRNMREYGFVGVWALAAIVAADRQTYPIVAVVAGIVAAALFVSSGLHGYRNRAYGPFRKRG